MNLIKNSFSILQALATPILVIDRKYLIIYANTAACKLFCLAFDNIVGEKCFTITHKFDQPCWRDGISCPVKTAFALKEQTRIIHEHNYSGKSVFEEIIATPIFDNNGDVSFVVEELNNITELIQSREISAHLKSEMKLLQGLLPICSHCKKIRDAKGDWNQLESYLSSHSEIRFSHGMCKDCIEKLYGDEEWYKNKKSKNK